MIAKVVLLCLALSALAKGNEVHYHYHMNENQAPKTAHKGYKLCMFNANVLFGGCMAASFNIKTKKDACRAARAKRQAECKAKNPQRRLSGGSMCHAEASSELSRCNSDSMFGLSDSESLEKKSLCKANFELKTAECDSHRALEKIQKHMANKEQHLLFCKSRAKHSWFWCDMWAKLRGGEHKEQRVNECNNKYNAAINACEAHEKPEDKATVTVTTQHAASSVL